MPTVADRFPELVPQRLRAVLRRMEERLWRSVARPHVALGPRSREGLRAAELDVAEFEPLEQGARFGPAGGGWEQQWFLLRLPAALSSAGDAAAAALTSEPAQRSASYYLFWDCDGEATVYHQGKPWAGLDISHRRCPLPPGAEQLLVEVATYQTAMWTSAGGSRSVERELVFRAAEIVEPDHELWRLYWDLEVLAELGEKLLEQEGYRPASREGYNEPFVRLSPYCRRLWHSLDRACDYWDLGDRDALGRHLQESYRAFSGGTHSGVARRVGHAHLDLVWLWPEAETERKAVHTFSTVLRLMEQDERFVFQHSSPWLFRRVASRHPGLYQEIQARIREGRWELSGALELESDVLLTSGEGLARNLRFGQEFIREQTGRYASLVWLPDVFGYPDCLPQLLRLSGARYFFTMKLSWSAITRFPHTAFRWSGSDGSEVLGYMSPMDYNGTGSLSETVEGVALNRQAGLGVPSIMPTGYGDGGGGPTPEMLERVRRQNDLAGVPKTTWQGPTQSFEEIGRQAGALPRYQGELYLEYHRGTYTTQKRFKTLVRQLERETLLLEALRALAGERALDYERWERLLLSQFHDAIPGSSIGLVYQELGDDLERELSARREETATTLERLGAQLHGKNAARSERGAANPPPTYAVANPLPTARHLLIESEASDELTAALERQGIPSQRSAQDTVLFEQHLEGFGIRPLSAAGCSAEPAQASEAERNSIVLDNGIVRAAVDSSGLCSMELDRDVERHKGTPIPTARGAVEAHADHPPAFDAWDIDQSAGGMPLEIRYGTPRVRERGPVRAEAVVPVFLGQSAFTLSYALVAGERALRVTLEGDWQEEHTLLRWRVHTEPHYSAARFGNPFGSTRRDTRPGSRAGNAKWELPGHLWAALSDDGEREGVAIVTEASYGFHAVPGELAVSLLRSPSSPDPGADRGRQQVRWAVCAHRLESRSTVPVSAASARLPEELFGTYALVSGSSASQVGGATGHMPFTVERGPTLVGTAVAPREDGSALVLRFHETAGQRGTLRIRLHGGYRWLHTVDLLGRELEKELRPVASSSAGSEAAAHGESVFELEYRAYEILNLEIVR
jgi:alpha-mannosidase